jgi:hypothetical protein
MTDPPLGGLSVSIPFTMAPLVAVLQPPCDHPVGMRRSSLWAEILCESQWSVAARIKFLDNFTSLADFLDHDEAIVL